MLIILSPTPSRTLPPLGSKRPSSLKPRKRKSRPGLTNVQSYTFVFFYYYARGLCVQRETERERERERERGLGRSGWPAPLSQFSVQHTLLSDFSTARSAVPGASAHHVAAPRQHCPTPPKLRGLTGWSYPHLYASMIKRRREAALRVSRPIRGIRPYVRVLPFILGAFRSMSLCQASAPSVQPRNRLAASEKAGGGSIG